MPNLKLTIEYDGELFFGYQKQKGQRNIQEVLEQALTRLFDSPIRVSGSGRTDSGVHAEAQVVSCVVPKKMPLRNVLQGMNAYLPDDVAVHRAQYVADTFHARFSAQGKTYSYLIWNSPVRSPLRRKYMYHVIQPLSVKKMRKAAAYLIGKHDFRAFCSQEKIKENTVRTIQRLTISQKKACIEIRICGDGFLYNMVRNIVGTLMLAGREKIKPSHMKGILTGKDRSLAGPTVPAHGLRLVRVRY